MEEEDDEDEEGDGLGEKERGGEWPVECTPCKEVMKEDCVSWMLGDIVLLLLFLFPSISSPVLFLPCSSLLLEAVVVVLLLP